MNIGQDDAEEVVEREEDGILPLFAEVHHERRILFCVLHKWQNWKIKKKQFYFLFYNFSQFYLMRLQSFQIDSSVVHNLSTIWNNWRIKYLLFINSFIYQTNPSTRFGSAADQPTFQRTPSPCLAGCTGSHSLNKLEECSSTTFECKLNTSNSENKWVSRNVQKSLSPMMS